jgi:hypothetical protein
MRNLEDGHVLFVCLIVQVFVASKFDNRMKEFAERWEVDKYLSATGYLPQTVKPFFVALPKVMAHYASPSEHFKYLVRCMNLSVLHGVPLSKSTCTHVDYPFR